MPVFCSGFADAGNKLEPRNSRRASGNWKVREKVTDFLDISLMEATLSRNPDQEGQMINTGYHVSTGTENKDRDNEGGEGPMF